MKTKTCVLCVVCIVMGFVLSGLCQSQSTGQENATRPGRFNWGYKMALNPSADDLNELGKDGWELVAVAHQRAGDAVATCYLKRPAR